MTKQSSNHHNLAHAGFTLIEVLVVMAIMVILFGMLFVPISSSIDMVSMGQRREQMRQQLQMAMEQVGRELADAQAVYLPEYIPLPGDDDKLGTEDDQYRINYSNITFRPPGWHPGDPVVRYAVMTPESDFVKIPDDATGHWYCIPAEISIDNPFVLYRMEGKMDDTIIPGRNCFGAETDIDTDGDGTPEYTDQFVIGYWRSRNALTPKRGSDIPVTETVIVDPHGDGYVQIENGFVKPGKANFPARADTKAWSDEAYLVYIHGGIQFGPLRIANERLSSSDPDKRDQTTFTAEYGNWAGLQNPAYRCSKCGQALYTRPSDGKCPVTGCDGDVVESALGVGEILWDLWGYDPGLLVNSSELRPRIVVRRHIDGSGRVVILDTDDLPGTDATQPPPALDGATVVDNMYGITWDSEAGTVSVASAPASPARAVFDLTSLPNPADPTDDNDTWKLVAVDDDDLHATSSDIAVTGTSVFTEPDPEETTLAETEPLGETVLKVADDPASIFVVDGKAKIRSPYGSNEQDLGKVTNIDAGNKTITVEVALTQEYVSGSIVEATPDGKSRKAYSTYEIAPEPVTIGTDDIYDKMIAPDSVRVWVTAEKSGERSTLEYTRVAFTDASEPTQDELDNIAAGQFAIAPSYRKNPGDDPDYRKIKIHFGNSEKNGGVRTPPPSPDDPSTFGGPSSGWDPANLSEFKIVVAYKTRRNFSTANLQNDYIEVSYSTREVYNINLQLLPWRQYEEDNKVWYPVEKTKGIQLHAQVPIHSE